MRARPKSYRISTVFRSAAYTHQTPPTACRDTDAGKGFAAPITENNNIRALLYAYHAILHVCSRSDSIVRAEHTPIVSPPTMYRKPTLVPV